MNREPIEWIDIDNDEAGDGLIRRLEDDAKPDTVERIASIIRRGMETSLTPRQMAERIAGMIFEGEALE